MASEVAYALGTHESVKKNAFHNGPYPSLNECIKETISGMEGELILEIYPDGAAKIVREWDKTQRQWVEPKGIL